MKINALTLGVTLALCSPLSASVANVNTSPWWEEFSSNPGFIEALPHIGYSLDALRQDTEKGLQESADSRTTLFWLKRTMDMYPPETPDHYNMPVAHHETKDWPNGHYATMGRGIFYFTRTFGETGQTLTINTGNIPKGANCYAATGRDFSNKDEMYLNQHPLTPNSDNYYTFKQSGILLLGCGDPDKQQNGQFVSLKVSGGDKSNLFILGQSTQSDWQAAKTTASRAGFAFLYDGHANTVVPNKMAQRTKEIIGKELGTNLRIIALYEKINGMDGSDPLFTSSMGSMFANYDTCCYADYRNGYVGIGFNSDKLHNDWGVWHEFGHQYEPTREALNLFSEIQVNRYSIEACQLFKGHEVPLNKCHSDITTEDGNWDKQAVENFLASNIEYQDYSAIKDLFKQLSFFSRLRFSYGENFFPKVNQARLKAIKAAPGNSLADKTNYLLGSKEKVIDFSVVAYSQAAGYDLRQYFTKWGLHFSASAGQKVAEMELPQPGEEQVLQISLSRDKITAVATYNTSFGYSVTARSNQDDVSYRWKRIGGDARIYTKTQEGATVEVVIPKNVEGVSTRFEVTAENRTGEDKKIVEVQALSPAVKITGPTETAAHEPVQLKAQANFDQATYDWTLKRNGQNVSGGIDASGQIAKNLPGGDYTAEVFAKSDKGGRKASAEFTIKVEEQAQNNDQAFINALSLSMQSTDNGDSVTFSGSVASSSAATSTPVYAWTLPAGAQGGSNGQPQQRFTVTKNKQVQNLKVKVKVTAGKEMRELERDITVPAQTETGQYQLYKPGTDYKAGEVVKNKNGDLFECKPWPYTAWCGSSSAMHYEPGIGLNWKDAWNSK
ncbi:M60 family metallopeptidase [Enterobacter bugandensis]|uniref:M60 family metallopeptidase n=1 Tax=Enterobacter bugandensis TaxID=881260 RepID=UPI0020756CD7|nr:M60 family metallopeptidase [Enterobacter bugandensis]MCM7240405.1 M60 family metallopeptidase [Enterobacter bugandensis]MCM7320197.1 M60 family metallopeptidase [Enterobacter bugandensis]MCM7355741.1 M60 family metallopeptidase [Enterobacter bugandensis]